MRTQLHIGFFVAASVGLAGCTVSQTADQTLTGPSTFATSVSVAAAPEIVTLGQTSAALGQQAQIIVKAFDATGQPKPNQTVRLEIVVNGQPSTCGHLSTAITTTGSDGRALAVFTAPGTPPNCPNFNSDGTITVRATPIGSGASSAAASGVDILMLLPPSSSSSGTFTASFAMSSLSTGVRNYLFDGSSSVSPGHSINSYRWIFSDGYTASGSVIDHDFGTAGTYLVTLTVGDEIDQSAFRTGLITVP
jgi:hypothetical protein